MGHRGPLAPVVSLSVRRTGTGGEQGVTMQECSSALSFITPFKAYDGCLEQAEQILLFSFDRWRKVRLQKVKSLAEWL